VDAHIVRILMENEARIRLLKRLDNRNRIVGARIVNAQNSERCRRQWQIED
jgi:hypothetical protein